MSDILITRGGLQKLRADLEHLYAQREALAERIKQALEQGGALPENGDYLDARHEQSLLESRIDRLEQRLRDAELVDPELDGELDIGERVRVLDLATGDLIGYRIVGTGEGDPALGDISHESPVGAALLGRRPGDVVEVEVPQGRLRLEVVEVVEEEAA